MFPMELAFSSILWNPIPLGKIFLVSSPDSKVHLGDTKCLLTVAVVSVPSVTWRRCLCSCFCVDGVWPVSPASSTCFRKRYPELISQPLSAEGKVLEVLQFSSLVLGPRNHLTKYTSTDLSQTGIVDWAYAPGLVDQGHGTDSTTDHDPELRSYRVLSSESTHTCVKSVHHPGFRGIDFLRSTALLYTHPAPIGWGVQPWQGTCLV